MKVKKFRQIVSTKFYKVPLREKYPEQRIYQWENTHKLLWAKGVTGIKTGITQSAGPCLVTSLSKDGYDLVIILLCCKSLDARWVETNKLASWSVHRMKKIKKFQNQQPQSTNYYGPVSNYNSQGGNDSSQQIRVLNRIKHL